MSKTIRLPDVPDDVHRELARRARRRGQRLSDYVLALLEQEASRPPADEVFARIERAEPVNLSRPAADLIREERASSEAH